MTNLKEGEKKLILMGFSVKDTQSTFRAECGSLVGSLRSLSAATNGKVSKMWAPPFQVKLNGFEINSTSGQKAFTQFNVSGM